MKDAIFSIIDLIYSIRSKQFYLCLKKPRFINISEFIRIKDQEEIKEVEKIFNNESLSEIDKGIIIPMKYSHWIYFTIKE